MQRGWYEVTAGGKLVKSATKIRAMFSKKDDISLGRTRKMVPRSKARVRGRGSRNSGQRG